MEDSKQEQKQVDGLWGWSFDEPLINLKAPTPQNAELYGSGWKAVEYLIARCERLENKLKPITIDQVKKLHYKWAIDNFPKSVNVTFPAFLAAIELFCKVEK